MKKENIKKLQEATSLTFEVKSNPQKLKTYNDDETLLLTLNLSYRTKTTAGALRKHLLERAKDSTKDWQMEQFEESGNIVEKDFTLYCLMLEGFVDWILSDSEMSKKQIEKVKEAIAYGEVTDILNTVSWQQHGENALKIERVPSNLSMMTCNCCMSKEMTADKKDFSRDIANKK